MTEKKIPLIEADVAAPGILAQCDEIIDIQDLCCQELGEIIVLPPAGQEVSQSPASLFDSLETKLLVIRNQASEIAEQLGRIKRKL